MRKKRWKRIENYDIRLKWYDLAVEFGWGLLMIAAFCWDWKNIIQIPGDIKPAGIPNPFARWLFLPAYLCSTVYFVLMMRRIISDFLNEQQIHLFDSGDAQMIGRWIMIYELFTLYIQA